MNESTDILNVIRAKPIMCTYFEEKDLLNRYKRHLFKRYLYFFYKVRFYLLLEVN